MINRACWLAILALFVTAAVPIVNCANTQETIEARVNTYLAEAKIENGVETLTQELRSDPDNDNLRFAIGLLQFVDAVQNLGQSWYRYGLRAPSEFQLPFLRLPVPPNPNPEPIGNDDVKRIARQMIEDLMKAEKTLSQIKDETAQLGIYFGRTYFDFDTDGKKTDQEALWRIYAQLNRQMDITEEQAASFLINFDAGDVPWLRGYCHLLSAILELYLTYDDSKLFDHTAHLFFENPETSYPFLKQRQESNTHYNYTTIVDAISLIHLINFPVIDAKHSESALDHLHQTIKLSRESWTLYGKETDDNHEWIPNPNQTGVIPGVEITQEMIQQWLAFLDEAEDLLSGKKLIPFWRGKESVGINLKRFFTEPRPFDLVLWFQGTAAAPYLEEGELTQPDFWRRLMNSFNGRFVGFALWFN